MAVRHTASSRAQDAFVRLSRAAVLAGRPGVAVLDKDLPGLSGGRREGHDLIAALEREGRLRRVRRGAYVLVDSTGGVRIDVLDLVAALTPDPYLVTGGRALQFHELTDQHFRRVHVLTPAQLRPWSWRGDEVRYVRTEKSLRGASTRTRRSRARVASAERAIADSLANPQWGVTLSQVVEALDAMLDRDPAFPDRLAGELASLGNHSVARRLGFLVTRIASADAARGFLALRGKSKASTPLQPGAAAEGPIDPTWGVRENIELSRLLQHREVY